MTFILGWDRRVPIYSTSVTIHGSMFCCSFPVGIPSLDCALTQIDTGWLVKASYAPRSFRSGNPERASVSEGR